MDNKQKGRSVKQSALDRFASWFFDCLKTGMFGYFFTSYDKKNEHYLASVERLKGKGSNGGRKKARKSISHLIERSVFTNVFPKIPEFLLRVSTRDYAIILFVMGAVVSILYPIKQYITIIDISFPTFISGILVCLCSLSLFFSSRSVSCDIISSRLMRGIIFNFCGLREEKFRIASEKAKLSSANVSFFIGLLLGVLSCFTSPTKILITAFIAFLAYAVLTTPEAGVIILIFAAPFASVNVLTTAVLYVSVCYIIKCIIGKRTFKFEYMDLWVVIFMLTLVFSGLVSVDRGSSVKVMLTAFSLVLSYFVVSNLIRSKEWYSRCIISVVSSSFIVLIIAVFQIIMANLSIVLPELSFFATSGEYISSSFATSSALASYIVTVLPFIITYMITKRGNLPKFGGFILIVLSVFTLVMTGSAEAFIGCCAAVMLLLLIYNKNFIYLFISLAVALPVLYLAFPDYVINAAYAYLGLNDISLISKLPTLRAAFDVMKHHPLGVGLGDISFNKASGMQDAGSLYTQIGAEMGFIALILFVALTVVFSRLIFSYCSKPKNRFRKISCSAGFASVVGIMTVGFFTPVFSDKSIFFLFFISIALSFSYVKIEREEERPKRTMVDISSASVDIPLSSDTACDNVPKRKYVHAPKAKQKNAKEESILKEFETSDLIRVIYDEESEENKNGEPKKHE